MRWLYFVRHGILAFALGCAGLAPASAQTLYVDPTNGRDTNSGTADLPLQTLSQVAAIVQAKTTPTSTTIRLRSGIYTLPHAVIFKNQTAYSKEHRLSIEALVLPDDPAWQPGMMPIIVSTEDPRKPGQRDQPTQTYGLKIQMSHVTVRGLKFLGNPLPSNWYCPLECLAPDMNDVLVTQCLFVGNPDTLDIYCAVITDGHQFVVDHCIFSGCHACVVFWDGGRGIVGRRNAMRYCLVDGARISGVWTCGTDEDLEFHHNIVTRSEYFWMRQRGTPRTYFVRDCVVTENKQYSGYGVETGATGSTGPEIRYKEERVAKEGSVVLEKDRQSRNYLHPVPRTPGSDLGAGLFTRRPR